MKRFILLIVIVNFHIVAYNQIINGTIFDRSTDSTICFAVIYLNGTFVGTYSDINGNFKLDISKNASMPITISCIGYNSVTLTDFSTDKPLLIYLKPKVSELKEVVVSAGSLVKERRDNLRLFKKEFLGTTTNALNCEIINEEDITFNYDSDRDTLKAYASKPILILNRALGYNITFYLDKFEYYRKSSSFFYKGNILFREDLTTEETNKQLYEERRKSTYLGSRMHFFRMLWTNDSISDGFEVRNSANENLNYKDIVIQQYSIFMDSLNLYKKFLIYSTNLSIYYHTNLSTIVFLKPKAFFYSNGYSDYLSIKFGGEMLTKRIGDALPFEYEIEK